MKGKQISNTEWGLVIGFLFMIDLVQWGLLSLAIGVLTNEFIDIFVGMGFALYLLLRGQIDTKRLIVLITGYLAEAGSDGVIPAWGLEGLYMLYVAKGEEVLSKVPGASTVNKFLTKKTGFSQNKPSEDAKDEQKAV